MRIGSKLALYKLKLVYDGEKGKVYQATAVENFQVKTKYGNDWEYHFIPNITIYTNLELEIANFDKDIEPKVFTKKDGTTFEVKQSSVSFDRISNPEKSIIRVLDFEYKIVNKRDKKGNLVYRPDKNVPYEIPTFCIYKCEYDYPDWRLPEKIFENQMEYYKNKHLQWKKEMADNRSEVRKIKKKFTLLSERNKELLAINRKVQKQLNTIQEKNDKRIENLKKKQKDLIKKTKEKFQEAVEFKTKPVFIDKEGNALDLPTFNEEEFL